MTTEQGSVQYCIVSYLIIKIYSCIKNILTFIVYSLNWYCNFSTSARPTFWPFNELINWFFIFFCTVHLYDFNFYFSGTVPTAVKLLGHVSGSIRIWMLANYLNCLKFDLSVWLGTMDSNTMNDSNAWPSYYTRSVLEVALLQYSYPG